MDVDWGAYTRVEEFEGRADSKHAEGLSQYPTCTRHAHAIGAMRRNSHARERKPTGVKSQKALCTREFAVSWPCLLSSCDIRCGSRTSLFTSTLSRHSEHVRTLVSSGLK